MVQLKLFLVVVVALLDLDRVLGYLSTPFSHCTIRSPLRNRQPGVTQLQASFFDDLRKFFEGDGAAGSSGDIPNNGENLGLPAGTYRVATIPVKSVKPGGLRLFLMFFLLGQQNTPERGAWKANQPSTEDFVLDFWFRDKSAVLTITLNEKEITIERTGSIPSTAYMMQETVVVQGILDELHQCAFDESVAEENRLIILQEPKDAIEKARDALAFA